ncbi:TRAP transporter substrate-binding protein DctP [Planctomycetota bacterium]
MDNKTRKYVVGLLVLFLLNGIVQARTVRMELGTLAPKNSSHHRILLAMGQKWRQAPGGGIRLKVFPSGVVGNESDMVREMRVGGIQAALLTTSGLCDIDNAVGNFQSLPMVFRNLEEFEYVYKKMQPDFEKRLAEKGFVVLFWADAGWVHFFTRNLLMTPEDLKGMKIFASSNVSETADMWQAGGQHPVPLDAADIPMGLQTGMIDAVTVPPIYAMATRMDTVAKHMLDLNWVPLVVAAVMQKKTWDALTPEAQVFVKTTAQEAAAEMVVKGRAEGLASIAAMQKRGLQIHHATPEVVAQWVTAVEAMHSTLRGGLVPEDIFDEVQRLLKEYRTAP